MCDKTENLEGSNTVVFDFGEDGKFNQNPNHDFQDYDEDPFED